MYMQFKTWFSIYTCVSLEKEVTMVGKSSDSSAFLSRCWSCKETQLVDSSVRLVNVVDFSCERTTACTDFWGWDG